MYAALIIGYCTGFLGSAKLAIPAIAVINDKRNVYVRGLNIGSVNSISA